MSALMCSGACSSYRHSENVSSCDAPINDCHFGVMYSIVNNNNKK